jgi:hypothetical protein
MIERICYKGKVELKKFKSDFNNKYFIVLTLDPDFEN